MKLRYKISSIFTIMLIAGFCFQSKAFIFRSRIDSIKIEYDQTQLVLPGESFNITVTAYRKNGKVRKTKGILGSTVGWWRFNIEVQGGENRGGRIKVNEQLLPSKGKYIGVKVIPKKSSSPSHQQTLIG